MPVLFSATIFASALLIFLVEPMFAKMVLPRLGGTPAVWNTCMVFYQSALLLGYAYAHVAPDRLGVRRHATAHLVLLAVPLAVLPIGVAEGWAPPAIGTPIPALVGLLATTVGLPFVVLAASSPLLQRWFAATGHARAGDPYFLYAASNLGSLAGLLGYPLLVEPNLTLRAQSRAWSAGYVALALLTVACAIALRRAGARGATDARPARDAADGAADAETAAPTLRARLLWLALAFFPSSLLLGVTTHISTDIASFPLLWVVPLALYLLSYVLAFAGLPAWVRQALVAVLWVLLPLMAILVVTRLRPGLVILGLNLLVFFLAAVVCHSRLAEARPPARFLTGYYLWMSAGGALGGLFNAVVAPIAFSTIVEYPLALALTATLLPVGRSAHARWRRWVVLGVPAGAVLLSAGLLAAEPGATLMRAILIGLPVAFCAGLSVGRPAALGLGLAVVVLVAESTSVLEADVIHRERGFYGVLRVKRDAARQRHWLIHGTTIHGEQDLSPGRSGEPLAYYGREGPIGQVLEVFRRDPVRTGHVGVVGLGAGGLAAYCEPGRRFTFYEIDPAVERIAGDPRLFTYLADARARCRLEVVLGDARLRLREAPPGAFGLLVLDAFSSDAIPAHLLTREALRLYLDKLAGGGLLALHISNGYLELEPIVAALAEDAGLEAIVRRDDTEGVTGRTPSTWALLARRRDDLGPLAVDPRWRALPRTGAASRRHLWTDDWSNLLGAIRW